MVCPVLKPRRPYAVVAALLIAWHLTSLAGCGKPQASLAAQPSTPQPISEPQPTASSASVPGWLGKPLASVRDPSKPPVVLFDSFHAHNFIHRGLVPGEHSYHRFTGLRRASQLLEARGCEVRELLVGPLTARQLAGVQLVVLNLPSADRPPWLVGEIAALEEYVRQGGGVIFVTDHSNCYYHQYHLLPLWDRLGLTPTFETVCERKPECMLSPNGSGWIVVRDFVEHPVTAGVRHFATQTGGRVAGEGIVAWTSDQAWADAGTVPIYGEGNMGLFGDMRYSDSEEQGKQGIILARGVGLGRVAVISDQNSLGDAFISYADNWQLWLSTCKWCGQLQWSESTTAQATAAASQSQPREVASSDAPSGRPAFDEIVSSQPDRNAPPRMAPDSWAIQCWEPLERGRFRWGGTNPDQYYYFWCWMNRWFWVTANDRSSRPSEQQRGRPMLLAIDSDIDDPQMSEVARQTLATRGKVILLPEKDLTSDGQPSDEDARRAIERAQKMVEADSITIEKASWSDIPLGHWRIDLEGGTLILIADARALRNARFTQPEIAPNPAVLKRENELRQWLFEQP